MEWATTSMLSGNQNRITGIFFSISKQPSSTERWDRGHESFGEEHWGLLPRVKICKTRSSEERSERRRGNHVREKPPQFSSIEKPSATPLAKAAKPVEPPPRGGIKSWNKQMVQVNCSSIRSRKTGRRIQVKRLLCPWSRQKVNYFYRGILINVSFCLTNMTTY